MRRSRFIPLIVLASLTTVSPMSSQTLNPNKPTWWAKYQQVSQHGAVQNVSTAPSLTAGTNVDVSDECGPQSETYITLNTNRQNLLAAGSNEIFRLPMRGYFSSNGGTNWGGVDLPLPPPLQGTNDTRFGSDPSLAFDSAGNLFYSYIIVFFGNGNGVNGTEMAVARSTDGGQTYPSATFFNFQTGGSYFNDKPMITTDTNPGSPFRNNVYVAWDAAAGGSASSGGILVGTSSDHGLTFKVDRADDPSGPSNGIGAVPFVGPGGELYVAWNDYKNNVIAFNRSLDGGATWGVEGMVSPKQLAFDVAIPAESFRGALEYPSCDADRSFGPHRGRLYCAWMDVTSTGNTNIFSAFSDDQGASWSEPRPVTDRLAYAVDRFNQWLSVDAITGQVNVSFSDTRNDTTGFRYMTDEYMSQSPDGATWGPNVRVSSASSNEHDCNGLFPCAFIDYGNQYGDYEGIVSYNGVSHPIWTDSRRQSQTSSSCQSGLMEEVFSATVR